MLENVLPKQFWVVLACLRSFLSFLGSFFFNAPCTLHSQEVLLTVNVWSKFEVNRGYGW